MRVENASIEEYITHRIYKPGRWNMGQHTKDSSFHSHNLYIDGEAYSFIAQGWRQYVYKSDTCEFDWAENNGYRNIDRDTLKVYNKSGERVYRGYAPIDNDIDD